MARANGVRYCSTTAAPTMRCQNCPARRVAFCADGPESSLDRLDGMVRRSWLSKEQFAVEEGEPHPVLLTVLSGSVRLFKSLSDGRRQITGFRAAGELVIAPSRHLPSPVSIQAIEPTLLCALHLDDLDALRAEDPNVVRRLDELIARRMMADHAHMLTLGRKSSAEKLASFLMEISASAPLNRNGADAVALSMLRQDIADYLGLECETTSRFFTRFRQEDMIDLPHPNRVIMRDLAGLEMLASGQASRPI